MRKWLLIFTQLLCSARPAVRYAYQKSPVKQPYHTQKRPTEIGTHPAALPWVVLVLVPMALGVPYPYDWYGTHSWKTSSSWLDIAVVALKYHPLCYFHLYLFGICLAIIFVRHVAGRDRAGGGGGGGGGVPLLVRNGAVVGYLGLALIFMLPALRPPCHKLLCRLGGLAPLQGLLLLGLANGTDAAARLLQVRSRVKLV